MNWARGKEVSIIDSPRRQVTYISPVLAIFRDWRPSYAGYRGVLVRSAFTTLALLRTARAGGSAVRERRRRRRIL